MKKIICSVLFCLCIGVAACSQIDGKQCKKDNDCDDGKWCNGEEFCAPGLDGADDRGCHTAQERPCGEGQVCIEAHHRCEADCDADGDGYTAFECGGDDCDDSSIDVNPEGREVCDEIDNDCDGLIDPGCDCLDGATRACGEPDGMGGFVSEGECEVGTQHCLNGAWLDECPGGVFIVDEACDGLDNNCDGDTDEGLLLSFYPDADDDSFGDDQAASVLACTAPWGYVEDHSDCDDGESGINPGQAEVCDLLGDNDCDPAVNPYDQDDDGHEEAGCGGDDCDDSNPSTYAGAQELCDRIDNDCSSAGGVDELEDFDNDGYAPVDAPCSGGPLPSTDCDDESQQIHPAAIEVCNGVDDDCDSETDEDPEASASCDPLPNVEAQACVDSTCEIAECAGSWLDCDGIVSTGCEVDTDTSNVHCGGCYNPCVGVNHCGEGACRPPHLWSQSFGSTSFERGRSVAVDGEGTVFMTGNFRETVNFGGDDLICLGWMDMFLASYNPDGTHRWSQRFGDGDILARSLAVDGSGNVYVTGGFSGTVDLGGGELTSSAGWGDDIFIASYDHEGVHRWSDGFGGVGSDMGLSVASDGNGNVYMTGTFYTSVDFGGGTLGTAGSSDMFLVSFDSEGAHRWSERYGGAAQDYGASIAVDALDNLYLTGDFNDTANFGGNWLTSAGWFEIFVASYTSGGVHRWSHRLGGTEIDDGNEIALGDDGNVYITGTYGISLSNGEGAIYLASYSTGGAYRWFLQWGTGEGRSLAVDANGNVHLTGNFVRTVNFGGGGLTSAGEEDAYVVSFTPGGVHRWSQRFGGPLEDTGWSIAAYGVDVYLSGEFQETVDFGGGGLTSAGDDDIFLLKLRL